MPRRTSSSSGEIPSRRRPAATPEDREAQMIELADQLAERQMREGSASAQVITHYLKLGSSRERLEQEKLGLEQELLRAKTESIQNQAKSEELFAEAIKAMRAYQGAPPEALDESGYDE